MKTITTIEELRTCAEAERVAGRSVGLVPTMGFLHEGHVSLMRTSAAANDVTVATIFVNPLQFAAGEDLTSYPRDLPGDAAKAATSGVAFLFTPDVDEMYPGPSATTVSVDLAVGFMESAARPTHFDGVATVVAKLFSIVGPCRAYFGEKDYQQLAIVSRMTADLNLPVEVVGCPTVREDDGLAMSSRNAYLTDEERRVAPALHGALRAGVAVVEAGERDGDAVRAVVRAAVEAEPLFDLDYAEVVDAWSLEPLTRLSGEIRLVAAARLGTPRLLDNLGVTVPA